VSLHTDPNYLKEAQYKDSRNLNARVAIHQRFSTNPANWQRWVWEQLSLKPNRRVLEVGCGPGLFWRENKDRLAGIERVIGDLSWGMVHEAKEEIGGNTFVNVDVQKIPCASESFDLVIANHMLYHVPQLGQGLSEMARVLRQGGSLCAATNGANHLKEMYELAKTVNPIWGKALQDFNLLTGFRLDNAVELVSKNFTSTEIRLFENALWVTEVQPIVDFLLSALTQITPTQQQIAELTHSLEAMLAQQGGIHITKETGLVLALKTG
jgi:ubiquinone/menaquinone biosynthesis C-methylase UbiE